MSIKKAIQEIRVELQKLNITKSGHNKFAGFKYYELSDFIPNVNELCLLKGIMTNFSVSNEIATLTIFSFEKDESIEFSTPFILPEIKGANATQNLGGAITYIKRYLYMNAFEIVENDHFDSVIGNKPKEDDKPKFKRTHEGIEELTGIEYKQEYLQAALVELKDKHGFKNSDVVNYILMKTNRQADKIKDIANQSIIDKMLTETKDEVLWLAEMTKARATK